MAKVAAENSWQLERIIPLRSISKTKKGPTAEEVTSLSADTIMRRYPELIRRPSPGRVGMKFKDALAIANGA
jgi:hypothetical protein